MPTTYVSVEKISPIRQIWTPRLLAVDAKRRYVYYSSELPAIEREGDIRTAAAKKVVWKHKMKLCDVVLFVDENDINVEGPKFDERQLYTMHLSGSDRPLGGPTPSRPGPGAAEDVGGGAAPDIEQGLRAIFLQQRAIMGEGELATFPSKAARTSSESHTGSLSPVHVLRKSRDTAITIRCTDEFTFMKLYTLLRNSLVVAGMKKPVHCGLPPYDPRNGIRFPLIPLHLRRSFKLLEHAVLYVFLFGQLVFLSKSASAAPLSLRCYLCITPDMVAVMRPDTTIPRWAALKNIESFHYQLSQKSRGPFFAFLTSGGYPDIVFEPLQPTFPPPKATATSSKDENGDDGGEHDAAAAAKSGTTISCQAPRRNGGFSARDEVLYVKDVMEKLMPMVTAIRRANGTQSHIRVLDRINFTKSGPTATQSTSTAPVKSAAPEPATLHGGAISGRNSGPPPPHSPGAAPDHTSGGDSTDAAPYTMVEVKRCKHVLQYMEEQVKFAGRELKWAAEASVTDELYRFLSKERLTVALGLEEGVPTALQQRLTKTCGTTSPIIVKNDAVRTPGPRLASSVSRSLRANTRGGAGAGTGSLVLRRRSLMQGMQSQPAAPEHADMPIATETVMPYVSRIRERGYSTNPAAPAVATHADGSSQSSNPFSTPEWKVTFLQNPPPALQERDAGQPVPAPAAMPSLGSQSGVPQARLPGTQNSDDMPLSSLPQSRVTFMDIPDDFDTQESQRILSYSDSHFSNEKLYEEDEVAFPTETSLGDLLRADLCAKDEDDEYYGGGYGVEEDMDLVMEDDEGIPSQYFRDTGGALQSHAVDAGRGRSHVVFRAGHGGDVRHEDPEADDDDLSSLDSELSTESLNEILLSQEVM